MEPLFFKAENSGGFRQAGRNASGLQWSRFFSKRKIRLEAGAFTEWREASMEPLFFKAENAGSVS